MRKHSKFSASGAERWFNCPGSVALSEGIPDRDNKWSIEGTKAHEVLEKLMCLALAAGDKEILPIQKDKSIPLEMHRHGINTANFILGLQNERPRSKILVETRIELTFIHPEMFGTFDGGIIEHFGTLDVLDYKYGKHTVSPIENLQMIFYGIGLAAKYQWNFKRVRLWIIQPRALGYDGPSFWELNVLELKSYVPQFKNAVGRVLNNPNKYVEGSWCHWCKAKGVCPLKQQAKTFKAKSAFENIRVT